MTACSGCEEQAVTGRRSSSQGFGLPEKQTITGVVGICTTTDDMELITADSSSVFVETFNRRIYGSCEPGDSVHVTYMDIDGHLVSSAVVNLRQIASHWEALPDSTGDYLSMDLLADNHVSTSVDGEPYDPYIQWNLFDGELLLTAPSDSTQPVTVDTFSIRSLSDDSLLLFNQERNIIYKKIK